MSRTTRRTLLRGAVGFAALGCATATATASDGVEADKDLIELADDRHGRDQSVTKRFDRIVDLAEAGVDRTGTEPIDPILDEYSADDTLVLLRDGRYAVEQIGFYKLENWGIVGVGDDVTLVPADEYADSVWVGGYRSTDIWFENLRFDLTDSQESPTMSFNSYDGVVVRDITVEGFYDDPSNAAFGFCPLADDGHILVENLSVPDGGNNVGIYIGHSRGTVTLRDCHVEGFWNNGVYASDAEGEVHVEGGLYRNNNVANVRIGSDGSYVRGATVVVDEDPSDRFDRDAENMRGIRISHGPMPGGTCLVENCEISMTGGQGVGGIVSAPNAGSFEVRDTRIHVDDGYTVADTGNSSFAISVDNTLDDTDPTAGGHLGHRLFENVSITGDASEYMAARFQRGNNTLRNVCIQQTAGERAGLSFQYGDDNRVENCTVNVAGYVVNGPATLENVEEDGACPLPNVASPDVYETDAADQSAYRSHSIPGRIQAEHFDVGGQHVAYWDTTDENKGGLSRDEAVDIERSDTRDGTTNLGWVADGEWLEYTVDASSGIYTLAVETAGWTDAGAVVVSLAGGRLARVEIPNTGNYGAWTTVTVEDVVVPVDGEVTLRLAAEGGSFNLNWFEFRT